MIEDRESGIEILPCNSPLISCIDDQINDSSDSSMKGCRKSLVVSGFIIRFAENALISRNKQKRSEKMKSLQIRILQNVLIHLWLNGPFNHILVIFSSL